MWLPTLKITISDEIFLARCDIMYEFCLMPKYIHASLNTWETVEGGEEITLTDNTTIQPIGVAQRGVIKLLGRTISTDYHVIECVGTGQITIGRSLVKLLGAIIDVGKGTMSFTSSRGCWQTFPTSKGKKIGKRNKLRAPRTRDAHSLGNT